MDLEFLLRQKSVWRETARGILFRDGDIVEHGEEAEEAASEDPSAGDPTRGYGGSLGIGSLRGRKQ